LSPECPEGAHLMSGERAAWVFVDCRSRNTMTYHAIAIVNWLERALRCNKVGPVSLIVRCARS
jgi:hypothetical protein